MLLRNFLCLVNYDIKFVLGLSTSCRRAKDIGFIFKRQFKRRLQSELARMNYYFYIIIYM